MSAYDQGLRSRSDDDADVVEIETVAVAEPLDENADDTEEIQEQIEQTRANMSETIDAIQDRLSPQRIGEQVRDQVREATIGRAEHMVSDVTDSARQAGNGFVEMIRANPVPAAMAALGLGWLWMKRSGAAANERPMRYGGYSGYRSGDGGDYGYRQYGYPEDYRGYRSDGGSAGPADAVRQTGQRAQQVAGQTVDRVQGAAGQVAGSVQQAAGQVQDSAQQLGAQVQYGAMRARYSLEDALYETPLGVGAIALAVGVAVGLAAPSTDFENQMMGEARDNVVQKAQDTAQDTLHKVQHVAERTVDTTKETAKQEAQKEGLTSSKG
jgi:gas vesicle protein